MQDTKSAYYQSKYQVTSFYCFTSLNEETINFLLSELSINARKDQIKGSVLIAEEGVNGTVCGKARSVEALINVIESFLVSDFLDIKTSVTSKQAFRRFKVRRKKEIVTMGVQGVNPNEVVGTYVEPNNWNDFLTDPQTIVIDTRNDYEVGIGSFKGSINPHTSSFRQFPDWVENTLRPLIIDKKPKNIAMFCTGGIRCEKATSYLKKEGFSSVHHLHGGILRYLEDIPVDESLWQGECFVFDQRVALNHHLSPGTHSLCHACGMPVSTADRMKETYLRGIQCPNCIDLFSDKDRLRFAERQRQIDVLSEKKPGNSVWPNA